MNYRHRRDHIEIRAWMAAVLAALGFAVVALITHNTLTSASVAVFEIVALIRTLLVLKVMRAESRASSKITIRLTSDQASRLRIGRELRKTLDEYDRLQ